MDAGRCGYLLLHDRQDAVRESVKQHDVPAESKGRCWQSVNSTVTPVTGRLRTNKRRARDGRWRWSGMIGQALIEQVATAYRATPAGPTFGSELF